MRELAKEQEPGATTSEVLCNYDAAEVTDVGACHPATTHRHDTANWTSFPVAAAAVAGYIAVESGPSNRTTDTEGHSSGRLRRHLPHEWRSDPRHTLAPNATAIWHYRATLARIADQLDRPVSP